MLPEITQSLCGDLLGLRFGLVGLTWLIVHLEVPSV